MTLSLIDWSNIILQIILLLCVLIYEVTSKLRANLFVITFVAASIVLVQGQALWVLGQFDETSILNHLNKTISIDGVKLAASYVSISVFSFFLMYLFLKNIKIKYTFVRLDHNTNQSQSRLSLLLFFYTIVVALATVNHLGGIEEVVSKPGQFYGSGATYFLVLLHVGRLQLIENISYSRSVTRLQIFTFSMIMLVQLFNGRSWMLFMLLQLCLVIYYTSDRKINFKLLLAFGFVFVFTALFFGMYRHFTSISGNDASPDVGEYISRYFELSTPFDWFYITSVEGFAGISGILSHELSGGVINHDMGLSNLGFFLKVIPAALKDGTIISNFELFLNGLYPYSDTITRSGYESFYAHFGVYGEVILGFLFCYLMFRYHRLMQGSNSRFITSLLSPYILILLYGNLFFLFFYWMTEFISLYLYYFLKWFSKGFLEDPHCKTVEANTRG